MLTALTPHFCKNMSKNYVNIVDFDTPNIYNRF